MTQLYFILNFIIKVKKQHSITIKILLKNFKDYLFYFALQSKSVTRRDM